MTLSHFRRTAFVPAFLAALIAFAQVAPALAAADAAGSRDLGPHPQEAGRPVAGATVLAYHLSSEEVFDPAATDAQGASTRLGRSARTATSMLRSRRRRGLYVADQVVNVPPSGKTVLTLILYPYTRPDAEEARSFPGTDADPVGVARVEEKPKGADFWKSGPGHRHHRRRRRLLLLLIASAAAAVTTAAPPAASAPLTAGTQTHRDP